MMKTKNILNKTLIIIMIILASNIVYGQLWQTNDWIDDGNYLYPYSLDYLIGVGTKTPENKLTVFGGNISILKNQTSGIGGNLLVDESINAKQICNQIGDNCKNLSSDWNSVGSSLDAADGSPTDALVVDNEGNITIIGKLKAPAGTICDVNGCIPDPDTTWKIMSGGLYYTGGKVEINAVNASLNITKISVSSGMADLLFIRPLTNFAGSGGAIVFDTGTSSGRIQYKHNSVNNGDFEFMTPNSGTPKTALTIKSDGSVGIGSNPTQTLDVNGSAIIRGDLTTDSVLAGGLSASANEITFVGGAKIITTNNDIIIRLP